MKKLWLQVSKGVESLTPALVYNQNTPPCSHPFFLPESKIKQANGYMAHPIFHTGSVIHFLNSISTGTLKAKDTWQPPISDSIASTPMALSEKDALHKRNEEAHSEAHKNNTSIYFQKGVLTNR